MSFRIVREKPYFINANGEKNTHIDMTELLSFMGIFIDEDGEETIYRFGYDFNKDEYLGIKVVRKEEIEEFNELYSIHFSVPNPGVFSIENLERGIVKKCFATGSFIITKVSKNYDCFFV